VCMTGDELPQLVYCEQIMDVDRLAFPARHLLKDQYAAYIPGVKNSQSNTASILLSRGCPYQCAFCGPHTRYKRRSIDNVAQELMELYKQGYFNIIVLDDLPFVKESQVHEFCDLMMLFPKMVFRCNFHASLFSDNSARWLKQAGCKRVQFGIESASEEILKKMKKCSSVDKNRNAIALCRAHGIESKAMFIWGLPGDNKETAESIIAWVKLARPDSIQISNYVPLPGSPLWQQGDSRKVVHYEALSFFDDYPHESIAKQAGIEQQFRLRRRMIKKLRKVTCIDRGINETITDEMLAILDTDKLVEARKLSV